MSALDHEISNAHKGSMGEHDTRHSIIQDEGEPYKLFGGDRQA